MVAVDIEAVERTMNHVFSRPHIDWSERLAEAPSEVPAVTAHISIGEHLFPSLVFRLLVRVPLVLAFLSQQTTHTHDRLCWHPRCQRGRGRRFAVFEKYSNSTAVISCCIRKKILQKLIQASAELASVRPGRIVRPWFPLASRRSAALPQRC